MSGPKYSEVEIERQRLIMLKVQLEAEIEQGKCAHIITNIKDCIKRSNLLIQKIEFNKYEKIITATEEIVKNKTHIHEMNKLIEELKITVSKTYKIQGNSEILSFVLNSYETRIKKMTNLISQIDSFAKKLNVLYNEQQQTYKEAEFEAAEWEPLDTFSNASHTLINTYNEIIEQLFVCENFEAEKDKYDTILNNHFIDDAYKISQMKMKFEAYLVERQSDVDNEQVLRLRSEYVVMCNALHGACQNVPDDIEVLQVEIAEMFAELQKRKVGEYVAESIEKVMQELGYGVISNEILEVQKMKKQYYDYSFNSAITIASSDNGAMMLEVVGKKNEDGFDGSIEAVKSDMERFCPDYKKVKQGLQKYGISLSDKKLCPPDEKYVRFVDIQKTSDRRITARNIKRSMYNE